MPACQIHQKHFEMHEVIECYNISGEFDFMLKVVEEKYGCLLRFPRKQIKPGGKYRACAECVCDGGD
jgi:DNA-binding Lrp family transcriptional regulator